MSSEELERLYPKSYAQLSAARAKAAKSSSYNTFDFRYNLTTKFRQRTGFEPREWQLDVAEANHLGLDSVLILGTGGGKTMPFIMPLLLDPRKKVIIISPLKLLQEDQARRFTKMGISSVAVNGDTWNEGLRTDLLAGKYQAILASPEMCLEHPGFRDVLTQGNFADISAINIDEAHCIGQWGGDFRKSYGKLSDLRTFFPPEIPIHATTATLTPKCLQEVYSSLKIDPDNCFYANLGNDRANIFYEVRQMSSADNFDALRPLLFDKPNPSRPEDLIKTIVFTNSVAHTQQATREVRKWLPRNLRGQVAYLHAHRGRRDKRRLMRRFRRGKIKILIATEAAGMGADIPDITQVIQFGVPPSLSVWFQRSGRGGRSDGMEARATMLVEESTFKTKSVNAKKTTGGGGVNDGEEAKEFVKKVDQHVREWIETTMCRRDVADTYFGNPPIRSPPRYKCCDNCEVNAAILRPATPLNDDTPSSTHTTPSKSPNANGKRPLVHSSALEAESDSPTVTKPRRSYRRDDPLTNARQALETWRTRTFHRFYRSAPFTSLAFLPDATLRTLAAAKYAKTLDHLKEAVSWVFVEKHGLEVLEVLRKVDDEWEREKKDNAERRKAATAARNAEKERLAQEVRDRKQAERNRRNTEKLRLELEAQAEKENARREREAAKAASKPPPKRPRRAALQGTTKLDFRASPLAVEHTPLQEVHMPLNSVYSTPSASGHGTHSYAQSPMSAYSTIAFSSSSTSVIPPLSSRILWRPSSDPFVSSPTMPTSDDPELSQFSSFDRSNAR